MEGHDWAVLGRQITNDGRIGLEQINSVKTSKSKEQPSLSSSHVIDQGPPKPNKHPPYYSFLFSYINRHARLPALSNLSSLSSVFLLFLD